MRSFILAAAMVAGLLTACGTAPKTAEQGAYDATTAFAVALKSANTYAALPRCSSTVKQPCSDQAAVVKAAAAANRAATAVQGLQKVAADTTSSDTDIEKAKQAANDAVASLAAIIPAPVQ